MRYLAVVSVLVAGWSFAQEPTPAAPEETAQPVPAETAVPGGQAAPATPEVAGQQVDPKELLEQVMMARITKELALDDQQAVLLLKRFSEYRDQLSSMRKKRFELMRDLKSVVKNAQGEQEINQKLDALIAHDEETTRSRMELFDTLSGDLTAWQRARLYVFLTEFEGDMRRMVQRARERFQGEGGEGRPPYRHGPWNGPGAQGAEQRPPVPPTPPANAPKQ